MKMMQYFWGSLIFLFGGAIGSFITVVVERYNTNLPFFRGRSFCFSCGTQLTKTDLLPVFSFLFLKGRCRHCGSKIPFRAFGIEVIMGILAVLAAQKVGVLSNFQFSVFDFQTVFQFLILTAILAVIVMISLYDLKHFIIPDGFLITLFILAFLHNSLLIIHGPFLLLLVQSLGAGIILAVPFLLIFIISRGTWFGLGDVKYILVLGFLLGLSVGLSAIVLAFWIGTVFALTLLTLKKISPHIDLPLFKNNLTIKSEIPFGPFLSLGILISLYLSLDIFHLYEIFSF